MNETILFEEIKKQLKAREDFLINRQSIINQKELNIPRLERYEKEYEKTIKIIEDIQKQLQSLKEDYYIEINLINRKKRLLKNK